MGMTDAQAEKQMLRAWRCRRRKQAFIQWLKSIPCADCLEEYPPVCMDFDHRPGTTKKFALVYGMNHEWAAIQREVAKCDVVCANCHRIRTAGRIRRQHATVTR